MLKKVYKTFTVFEGIKVNIPNLEYLSIDFNVYDLLITVSDPKSSHLIGKYLRNHDLYLKTWYQYWGDPMYIDITRKKGLIKNTLVKYNEKKLISFADKVIYASPLTLIKQKELYPKYSNKMEYCNQVASKRNFDNNREFFIGYFGAYVSHVRNIYPLYKALIRLSKKSIIAGNSDINLESTNFLEIHKRLPYKEALDYENKSSILVTLCNSSGTQIPGKIYYCASQNKPIIVIIDGEYSIQLFDYLSSFNRYIICNNDENSILEAINMAKKSIEKNVSLSKQLQIDHIGKKIMDIYNK